jgi:hypothetical protein
VIYLIMQAKPTEEDEAHPLGPWFVKIGWAVDPEKRLRELRPGNPCEIELMRTAPGGPAEESQLHRVWEHRQVRREWFCLSLVELEHVYGYFDRASAS